MRSSRNTVSLQYHQWWVPAGPSRSAEGSSPRSTVWSTTAFDCSSGPPREERWSRAGTAHASAPSPPTGRSRPLPQMTEERLLHSHVEYLSIMQDPLVCKRGSTQVNKLIQYNYACVFVGECVCVCVCVSTCMCMYMHVCCL